MEVIPIGDINEAYERMLKNDVRYRFVHLTMTRPPITSLFFGPCEHGLLRGRAAARIHLRVACVR